MSVATLPEPELFEELDKLNSDLRDASRLLGRREARYLVDMYYAIQDFRIQAAAQIRSSESEEPDRVLDWVFNSTKRLENNIKNSLGMFAKEYNVGQWEQSICGIGPVISAGFLAHLDIRLCKTAGQFWRFAGLDPTTKWEKKTKRPWNAKLKVLCWKLGESFVKVHNNDKDFYGQIYVARKDLELERNERGEFAGQAIDKLEAIRIGKDTEAYKWYAGCVSRELSSQYFTLDSSRRTGFINKNCGEPGSEMGKLPPAHIHSRAKRYAVKLFLSHLHEIMYRDFYGDDPPVPYSFEHSEGNHRHYIDQPNNPVDGDGNSLTELFEANV